MSTIKMEFEKTKVIISNSDKKPAGATYMNPANNSLIFKELSIFDQKNNTLPRLFNHHGRIFITRNDGGITDFINIIKHAKHYEMPYIYICMLSMFGEEYLMLETANLEHVLECEDSELLVIEYNNSGKGYYIANDLDKPNDEEEYSEIKLCMCDDRQDYEAFNVYNTELSVIRLLGKIMKLSDNRGVYVELDVKDTSFKKFITKYEKIPSYRNLYIKYNNRLYKCSISAGANPDDRDTIVAASILFYTSDESKYYATTSRTARILRERLVDNNTTDSYCLPDIAIDNGINIDFDIKSNSCCLTVNYKHLPLMSPDATNFRLCIEHPSTKSKSRTRKHYIRIMKKMNDVGCAYLSLNFSDIIKYLESVEEV